MFHLEISQLKEFFPLKLINSPEKSTTPFISVTKLVSQSFIEPYSLEEHNPSTGFVLRHVSTAVAKLLFVIVVIASALLKVTVSTKRNNKTIPFNTSIFSREYRKDYCPRTSPSSQKRYSSSFYPSPDNHLLPNQPKSRYTS